MCQELHSGYQEGELYRRHGSHPQRIHNLERTSNSNLILCHKCCNWEIHIAFGSKEDYLLILHGWVEKRLKNRMLII